MFEVELQIMNTEFHFKGNYANVKSEIKSCVLHYNSAIVKN